MCETSFNGVKITWDQMAYLQSILSPQQFIAFLQMKKDEPRETTKNVTNPVSAPTEPVNDVPFGSRPQSWGFGNNSSRPQTGLFGNDLSRPQNGLFGNNSSSPQTGVFGRPSE